MMEGLGADGGRGLMAGLLAGKRLLITGVITKDSIAFHVAQLAQAEGAEVLLTSFGRVRRMTERAAEAARPRSTCSSSTSTGRRTSRRSPRSSVALGQGRRFLHAIAFAPEDALGGKFLTAPAESAAPPSRRAPSR